MFVLLQIPDEPFPIKFKVPLFSNIAFKLVADDFIEILYSFKSIVISLFSGITIVSFFTSIFLNISIVSPFFASSIASIKLVSISPILAIGDNSTITVL